MTAPAESLNILRRIGVAALFERLHMVGLDGPGPATFLAPVLRPLQCLPADLLPAAAIQLSMVAAQVYSAGGLWDGQASEPQIHNTTMIHDRSVRMAAARFAHKSIDFLTISIFMDGFFWVTTMPRTIPSSVRWWYRIVYQ